MYFTQLLHNSILWTALLSWAVAQVMKFLLTCIIYRRIDIGRFFGSGGMPSSHSALVVSATCGVGFVMGFNSPLFAACAVLSCIVMYDAAGVRRSSGQQAKILNKLMDDWWRADYSHTEKRLKEFLGHTPIEVFAGSILGIIISTIVFVH